MWKETESEKPKKKKYLYLDKFDTYRAEKDAEFKSILKAVRGIKYSTVLLYVIQLLTCLSIVSLYHLIMR